MKKLTAEKITAKQQAAIVSSTDLSKSEKIRQLFNAGLEVKEIASLLNMRYNFAYNVISNYISMNAIAVQQEDKVSKKQLIIDLHLQEKSNKEISIELKTNYNYVFNTIKAYKASQASKEA